MSTLLTRASAGVYTPGLASSVQAHAARAATQAAAAQGEIQRVLGQVHEELRRNGMQGVDDKLRELEAITAGWTAQLRAGLLEVQRMAEQRHAAAAAAAANFSAQPDPKRPAADEDQFTEERGADTSAHNDESACTPTPDSTHNMPGAFVSPAATLFDGFTAGRVEPSATATGVSAVSVCDSFNRQPAPFGAPPAATHGCPAGLPSTRQSFTGGGSSRGSPHHRRLGHGREGSCLHVRHGLQSSEQLTSQPAVPSPSPAEDVAMAEPWLDRSAVAAYQTKADGQSPPLEQALGQLIEAGLCLSSRLAVDWLTDVPAPSLRSKRWIRQSSPSSVAYSPSPLRLR